MFRVSHWCSLVLNVYDEDAMRYDVRIIYVDISKHLSYIFVQQYDGCCVRIVRIFVNRRNERFVTFPSSCM